MVEHLKPGKWTKLEHDKFKDRILFEIEFHPFVLKIKDLLATARGDYDHE